jgi:DNA-binding transcriptional ArsR family regulator
MADDTRQSILQFLCTPGAGEMKDFAVTEIADHFDLTTSTVSHHLQLLRREGLVRMKKAGKERHYSLHFENLRKSVGQFNDLLAMIEQAEARARSLAEQ